MARLQAALAVALTGCSASPSGSGVPFGSDTGELPSTSTGGSSASEASSPEDTTDAATVADDTMPDEPLLDVGPPPNPEPGCDGKDLDRLGSDRGPLPCDDQGPPDAFSPVLEWSFPPKGSSPLLTYSIPLVANLSDDNGDGAIDTCDTPDVLLVASFEDACRMLVIDGNYGETGLVHVSVEVPELQFCDRGQGAIADIDGDSRPDFVVPSQSPERTLLAFDATGERLWESEPFPEQLFAGVTTGWMSGAVFIADVDADGVPEILFNHAMYDADGNILWAELDSGTSYLQSTIAVDLDGDGRLEVLTGQTAWRFDAALQGTLLWDIRDAKSEAGTPIVVAESLPHVANLDADAEPEILYTTGTGWYVVEADGTPWWDEPQWIDDGNVCPALADLLDDPQFDCSAATLPGSTALGSPWTWYMRPAAIADFDSDGDVEVLVARRSMYAPELGPPAVEAPHGHDTGNHLSLLQVSPAGVEQLWSAPVIDGSGASGATAFDFLADGLPEPVYSDEQFAYAFSSDASGYSTVVQVPRNSGTWIEYPVVADVDNDGSAEFLVVSYDPDVPGLQVYGDAESRWVQARRIWNQQQYFVTNVHEDGTIPREPVRNWDHFNTFRVNSPIEGGVLCRPEG